MVIVSNGNTRKRCEIYSKLTIKTPELRSSVLVVSFEHISHFFRVSTVNFKQVNV